MGRFSKMMSSAPVHVRSFGQAMAKPSCPQLHPAGSGGMPLQNARSEACPHCLIITRKWSLKWEPGASQHVGIRRAGRLVPKAGFEPA